MPDSPETTELLGHGICRKNRPGTCSPCWCPTDCLHEGVCDCPPLCGEDCDGVSTGMDIPDGPWGAEERLRPTWAVA
jgi:hypothetical protein